MSTRVTGLKTLYHALVPNVAGVGWDINVPTSPTKQTKLSFKPVAK